MDAPLTNKRTTQGTTQGGGSTQSDPFRGSRGNDLPIRRTNHVATPRTDAGSSVGTDEGGLTDDEIRELMDEHHETGPEPEPAWVATERGMVLSRKAAADPWGTPW
jgi:hypothetical protein